MENPSSPASYQGFLAGAGSGFHRSDGLRRLPASLEQPRGHTAVARFLHGSSLRPQQSSFPIGTRSLHGSRVVSESAGAFANRPLSPHLALKKPQLSATYSISHRIFGASVASLILLSPLLMKYSVTFDI